MNKRLLTILISLAIALNIVSAQQDVMFTQYMFNEVTINPAYAGSHDVVSLTGLVREQWVGIEGAPSTQSFNAHTPLRNNKIGLGMSLINDKIGVSNKLNLYGSGSYRLKLSESMNLQFGLQAGFTHHRADLSSLDVEDGSEEIFTQGTASKMLPNFGGGLYFFTDVFYLGFSVPQLITNKLVVGDLELAKQERHYFVTAGYVFELSDKVKLKPTMFYKYVKGAPMQLDFTGSFIVQDKYWIGGAWRSFESVDLLLGYQATEQLFLGYAFDYSLTNLNEYNSGSHELVVNYRFAFSKNKILTPRYF